MEKGEFPLKKKGGCKHKLKIYYDKLPYTYEPFGKINRRIGNYGSLVNYSTEEQSYEFETTAENYETVIDYMRSFGAQRDSKVLKAEIEFSCDEEVIPSDGKREE